MFESYLLKIAQNPEMYSRTCSVMFFKKKLEEIIFFSALTARHRSAKTCKMQGGRINEALCRTNVQTRLRQENEPTCMRKKRLSK